MLETEITPNDSKWYSEIEAAQIVSNPDVINWNDEADLVVLALVELGLRLPMKHWIRDLR